ncbi:helix-turn-helix domain-containing protein [Amycolatopsis keratiniphila]|uniref:XRE family transcriptional regulator n=1 Tax=Amycolatopsis keratiniphila TaxID=129921 RepID=W6HVS3_9PSEU|nr:helix-turn-helix transcriptional regulator [Amycolatopsis keratiniphila]AHJ58554.1 XRE family transcriptional regulator [Amycolatopsis keratiniphila]
MPSPPASDFAVALGERLRAARQARTPKWSLERLGRRARVHWTYIGQIERGEVHPSVLVVARLADALQIDLGELMAGLPAPPPGKDPDE